MGSEQLQQLKSVLRSLVVSSPSQVDARSLARDYRTMQGEPVPLQRFGYRDFTLFLRERCSDCFLLSGHPSNPVLTLIVTENLKHIDAMVQKQKRPPSSFKAKRISVPEACVKTPSKYVPPHLRPKTVSQPVAHINNTNHYNNHSKTNEHQPRPVTKAYVEENNNVNINKTANKPAERVESKATVQPMPVDNRSQEKEDEEISNRLAIQNFFRKRMPLGNTEVQEAATDQHSSTTKSKDDEDSGRQTSSSGGSSKRAQLEELSLDVSRLVRRHPGGIMCNDILRIYREEYSREIPHERLGYRSVAACLRAAEDGAPWRLWRAPSAADWCVSPREHAPKCATPAAAAWARREPGAPEEVGDPNDAMPGIDFEEDVFPADCLHYVESVPAASCGAAPGELLEVCVGEVYSPSALWLIRLGPAHDVAMERAMDEMNVYYKTGPGADRRLALGAVRVGHYVAALFEGDWHRALVVRLLDVDTVKVRHVDYGTVTRAAASQLRPLLRCWATLPAQALRARLWGLRPPPPAARWPLAAAAALLRRVQQRRLAAAVASNQDGLLEVILVDTSGDLDVNINDELVSEGLAAPAAPAPAAPAAPPAPHQEHLQPSFAELESGDAPNYAELLLYKQLGLDPACVAPPPRAAPAPRPRSSSSSSSCSGSCPGHGSTSEAAGDDLDSSSSVASSPTPPPHTEAPLLDTTIENKVITASTNLVKVTNSTQTVNSVGRSVENLAVNVADSSKSNPKVNSTNPVISTANSVNPEVSNANSQAVSNGNSVISSVNTSMSFTKPIMSQAYQPVNQPCWMMPPQSVANAFHPGPRGFPPPPHYLNYYTGGRLFLPAPPLRSPYFPPGYRHASPPPQLPPPLPPPATRTDDVILSQFDCEVFTKLSLVSDHTAALHLQDVISRATSTAPAEGGKLAIPALDCEVFAKLMAVDCKTAVQHMRGAMERARAQGTRTSALNPAAAEFRFQSQSPPSRTPGPPLHPNVAHFFRAGHQSPWASGNVRPPPGF